MKKIIISNFPVGPKFNGGSMTVWELLSIFWIVILMYF